MSYETQREKEQPAETIGHSSDKDKDAFNHTEQIILKGLLFEDSQFNRDGIVKATGLSRTAVMQLIQEFPV